MQAFTVPDSFGIGLLSVHTATAQSDTQSIVFAKLNHFDLKVVFFIA